MHAASSAATLPDASSARTRRPPAQRRPRVWSTRPPGYASARTWLGACLRSASRLPGHCCRHGRCERPPGRSSARRGAQRSYRWPYSSAAGSDPPWLRPPPTAAAIATSQHGPPGASAQESASARRRVARTGSATTRTAARAGAHAPDAPAARTDLHAQLAARGEPLATRSVPLGCWPGRIQGTHAARRRRGARRRVATREHARAPLAGRLPARVRSLRQAATPPAHARESNSAPAR